MKKILIIIILVIPLSVCGQIDTINIGTSANSGDGESLRSAMLKVNNFMDDYNGSYLYRLAISNNNLTLTTTGSTNVTLPTTGRIIASGDTATMLTKYARKVNPEFTGTVQVMSGSNLTFEGGGVLMDDYGGLEITSAVVSIVGALDIGQTGFNVDSIAKLSDDSYAVYNGVDTIPPYIPDAYTDDPYDLFPEIHAFAGDTSNYAIPDKIGDLFINTATSKVYVSVSTSRGGWVILNLILPLFIFVRRRRRK